eukprot:357891-Chlamydomonas_euryale.AAC.2
MAEMRLAGAWSYKDPLRDYNSISFLSSGKNRSGSSEPSPKQPAGWQEAWGALAEASWTELQELLSFAWHRMNPYGDARFWNHGTSD